MSKDEGPIERVMMSVTNIQAWPKFLSKPQFCKACGVPLKNPPCRVDEEIVAMCFTCGWLSMIQPGGNMRPLKRNELNELFTAEEVAEIREAQERYCIETLKAWG